MNAFVLTLFQVIYNDVVLLKRMSRMVVVLNVFMMLAVLHLFCVDVDILSLHDQFCLMVSTQTEFP